MKKILLLAASLSLAGCGAVPTVVSAVSDVVTSDAVKHTATKVTIEGTRALVLAHNAYQGAAAFATGAIKSGQLSDDTVRKIVAINERAVYYLEGGGKALDAAERAAALLSLADELNRLTGN